MSNFSFGLNTRNISTSNRTSAAVIIGSLKGGSKGSTSRIYKWCNRHCPENPIACVFEKINNKPPLITSSWQNIDVSQLNLGEITGNIGEDGDIILGGSNGGQLQYSTNLGNSWAPYTNSPNLPGVNSGQIIGIGWSSVVMSDDTKFVVGTPYVPNGVSDASFNQLNGIYYRRDSAGWFLLQSCPLEGSSPPTDLSFNDINGSGKKLLFISSGISQNGNYMAAITTPRFDDGELVYLIYSTNAGVNWSAKALDPYNTDIVTTVTSSISICDDASDYFLITSKLYYNSGSQTDENGTCCVSNNGGTTFTVPSNVSGNDFIYSSMSNSGQYQVVVTATKISDSLTPLPGIPSRLYLSSNSGTNISQIIQLLYTNDNSYLIFGGVSMSADGKYITASVLDQDGNFQYIYLSSNIGVTWTKIYNDINGSQINVTGQYAGFLNTNYSGEYQMLTGTNTLYINNNFGN
jgi:hypothetical protein